MHEFSLAINIVEIAENEAKKANAGTITSVEVESGTLSGVVVEALKTALESATRGTMLDKAQISINVITGRAKCLQCFHEFETDDVFSPCPACGTFNPEITTGKELRVKSIEVE